MKWWHEAKFGMFIHWGLYSTLGRHEWVMETEGIPAKEYRAVRQQLQAQTKFRARLGAARKARGHEIHGAHEQTSRKVSATSIRS